jgi:uncharacterized membrane protein YqgA involved in biofilm formation
VSTIGVASVVVKLCEEIKYWVNCYIISFLYGALMAELLIVGGLMIVASGLSLLKLKDCKTLNMLPSLLVPVLWFVLKNLI